MPLPVPVAKCGLCCSAARTLAQLSSSVEDIRIFRDIFCSALLRGLCSAWHFRPPLQARVQRLTAFWLMEHGRLAILLAVLALNRSFLSLFGSERLTKGCGHAILANLRLVYSGCQACCYPRVLLPTRLLRLSPWFLRALMRLNGVSPLQKPKYFKLSSTVLLITKNLWTSKPLASHEYYQVNFRSKPIQTCASKFMSFAECTMITCIASGIRVVLLAITP